jgi:UPF0271 protein
MRSIDLNADLGEGAACEQAILPWITSANIACGGHAGDDDTMRAAVEQAARHRVGLGAHPGFADPEHFGRRELPVTPEQAFGLVLSQTRRLQGIVRSLGMRLGHVKPHGALYNLAATRADLAAAIAEAVREADPDLRLFGLAGSLLIRAGRAAGLAVASEVFADRTYQSDGSLTPRSRPDALLGSVEAAVRQVRRMVTDGYVRSTDGQDVAVKADTVCIHGDGPHAGDFAQHVRIALEAEGVQVCGLTP